MASCKDWYRTNFLRVFCRGIPTSARTWSFHCVEADHMAYKRWWEMIWNMIQTTHHIFQITFFEDFEQFELTCFILSYDRCAERIDFIEYVVQYNITWNENGKIGLCKLDMILVTIWSHLYLGNDRPGKFPLHWQQLIRFHSLCLYCV